MSGWFGWALLAGVIIGILLAGAHREAKERRRQEANRKRLRKWQAYADLEDPQLRRDLGLPPGHPNCRCTLGAIDAALPDYGKHAERIRRNIEDLGFAGALEVGIDWASGRSYTVPSREAVDAVLEELERLSSSTE
jgi:hypothetical protein